jgi:hypothetical protein
VSRVIWIRYVAAPLEAVGKRITEDVYCGDEAHVCVEQQ